MLIQGYERARARMLIPLRVSFTFSFNPAPSHQHCFKLSRVERSLFVLKKREKEKKIDGAPYESSVPSLSLSKHKDHYKSIKVCHVWNAISLCSRGIAWSVLVLDAAVAAVVAGCVVPRCQGLWGQAVPADRQRGRKPDSAAKPQSNVCLSSYLSLRLSLWLTVGHCLSACRILLLCSQEQSTACSWVTRSKKSYFYSFQTYKLLWKDKSSCLSITGAAAELTCAESPLSLRLVPRGAGCDNIRIMSRHVWREGDGSAECVCIWCGGRKLFYNEEGCQDMRWEVGSWRQDISYERETNVRKCRGCCCCGAISQNVPYHYWAWLIQPGQVKTPRYRYGCHQPYPRSFWGSNECVSYVRERVCVRGLINVESNAARDTHTP